MSETLGGVFADCIGLAEATTQRPRAVADAQQSGRQTQEVQVEDEEGEEGNGKQQQQQLQQQQEGDEGEEDVKAEQEVEEEGEAQETRGGVKSNSQQRSSGATKLGPRRWHAGPQPGGRGRGRGGPQGQNEWDV